MEPGTQEWREWVEREYALSRKCEKRWMKKRAFKQKQTLTEAEAQKIIDEVYEAWRNKIGPNFFAKPTLVLSHPEVPEHVPGQYHKIKNEIQVRGSQVETYVLIHELAHASSGIGRHGEAFVIVEDLLFKFAEKILARWQGIDLKAVRIKMRKSDKYDRQAQKMVGQWTKRHRKLQGVKPLPRGFWISICDDLHVFLRQEGERNQNER